MCAIENMTVNSMKLKVWNGQGSGFSTQYSIQWAMCTTGNVYNMQCAQYAVCFLCSVFTVRNVQFPARIAQCFVWSRALDEKWPPHRLIPFANSNEAPDHLCSAVIICVVL